MYKNIDNTTDNDQAIETIQVMTASEMDPRDIFIQWITIQQGEQII